jgi:hypothetical protein
VNAKMPNTNLWEEHIYKLFTNALAGPLPDQASQIYALSFFIYDDEDGILLPTVTLGYNTEAQYKLSIPQASDDAEARWNYAFWLQNELAVVGRIDDKTSEDLRLNWMATLGVGMSIAELDHFINEADHGSKKAQKLFDKLYENVQTEFMTMCIRISQRLHKEGYIKKVFGRELPILLHDYEYYDETIEQTAAANPPGLADEFCEWIESM